MEKENLFLLAQLLNSMKDISLELSKAIKRKDFDKANKLKKELLSFQAQVNSLL